MQKTPRPWGQHLILDLAGCPRQFLTETAHLRAWVSELIEVIGMKAYGEPSIEHFATHCDASAGFTLVQLIETSNICAHFAENLGQAYIDIFSCRNFDNDLAENVCRKYFVPETVVTTQLNRGVFPASLAAAR